MCTPSYPFGTHSIHARVRDKLHYYTILHRPVTRVFFFLTGVFFYISISIPETEYKSRRTKLTDLPNEWRRLECQNSCKDVCERDIEEDNFYKI